MSSVDRFEQLLADMMVETAPSREPDRLVPEILRAARRERRRPRWLALIKEPPMRLSSRVAVGSPVARVAYVAFLTLILVVVTAGAVVSGASLLASPEPGGPRTIVVDQAGGGHALTINEGIALAQVGDTVLVKPGTYVESIALTSAITVRGDGARGTVILEFTTDGPTHTWAPSGTFAYGVLLEGSDARVENLTVRGPAEGGAFVIDGGAPVIEGVDIVLDGDIWGGPSGQYYKRSAFRIQGGSSPVIRDSTWNGYTRIQGGANAPTFEGNTVSTQQIAIGGGGQRPVIRSNTFLDGAEIGWGDTGSSGIVEDNDLEAGKIGGPVGDDTTIRGNHLRGGYEPAGALEGERGAAILINGSGTAIVEGNEITDSPYGIEVRGFGVTPVIRGNTIRGSTSVAIIIDVGAEPTIGGNTIEDSAVGIEVVGTATPILECNTLSGNGTDLVVPDGSGLTLDGDSVCADASPSPAG